MLRNSVREISTKDSKALKEFVVLERQLLGGYPYYVSNFDQDVIKYLSGRSAFTSDAEISLFAVSNGHKDVARFATIVNPRYQAAKNEKVGFIGYFAAAPDCLPQVLAMLDSAEGQLMERGVSRVIAPYNGNALLGTGFLAAAFDEEPVMFASWNPPYYNEYFKAAGYQPTYPLWVYSIDTISPKFKAAEELAASNRTVRVRPIDKGRWYSDLEIFRMMINDNFIDEWEWYPAMSEEFQEFFDRIKFITDTRTMLIAEVQGEPVGVRIAFPNWNPLARAMQGKSGVWQKVQALWRGRSYESAGFAFTAVKPEYRGLGISPLLGVHLCQHFLALGVKKIYSYFINESNIKSRHAVESIGGVGRVLYQTYDKVLK
jgi:GNAT superfamily N-acetyltransferase